MASVLIRGLGVSPEHPRRAAALAVRGRRRSAGALGGAAQATVEGLAGIVATRVEGSGVLTWHGRLAHAFAAASSFLQIHGRPLRGGCMGGAPMPRGCCGEAARQ